MLLRTKRNFKVIRMYNTDDDVLVMKKSDYQNSNIGDEYFIVPKEEWLIEDDDIRTFHLFLTKVEDDRISLYFFQGKFPVIFAELPLSRRGEYVEV